MSIQTLTIRDLVFISYSHKDEPPWLERLKIFLKPFERQGRLRVWSDPYIRVGTEWRREIGGALDRARIAVLLVSPYFLASDFIQDIELPALLKARNERQLILVPIPVSASAYEITALAEIQFAQDPSRPLDGLSDSERNAALVRIVKTIDSLAAPVPPEQVGAAPGEAILAPAKRIVVKFASYTALPPDIADALPADLVWGDLHGISAQSLTVLSESQALALLAEWTGKEKARLPDAAKAVAEKCGYLPLALSLAAARVRGGASFREVLAALEKGDPEFLDHPYGTVFKSLRMSIDALPPLAAARYRELAVFPEDTEIPVGTVCRLWRFIAGFEDHQTLALLESFKAKGLLYLSGDEHQQRVRLHDLQHDFLRLIADDLPALDRSLLDAYRIDLLPIPGGYPAGWMRLPRDEPYLWTRLARHLAGGGLTHELKALLASYSWIAAKLDATDVDALLADYAWLPGNPDLVLIEKAIRVSADVLAVDKTKLACQLIGRLKGWDRPVLKRLVADAEQYTHASSTLDVASNGSDLGGEGERGSLL